MSLPAGRAAEREKDELPGHESEWNANWVERHLEHRVVRPADLGHAVVVDRDDEAREELAVEVGGDSDTADHEVDDAKQCRGVQDRVDEGAVGDCRCDEDPGQPMRRQPVLVRRACEAAYRPRPACRTQRRRQRPQGEHDQPEQRDDAEAGTDPGRVAVGRRGRERPVRDQQEHSRRRRAPVPDDDAVETGECALDRRQQRRQRERAREEEDRLRAEDLADEAAGRLPGRPRGDPEDDVRDRDA